MAAKKLTLFPFLIIRKTSSREIAEKVEVYCVCRRLEYQLLSSTSASLEDWSFSAVGEIFIRMNITLRDNFILYYFKNIIF
jgi:hypothetical protein